MKVPTLAVALFVIASVIRKLILEWNSMSGGQITLLIALLLVAGLGWRLLLDRWDYIMSYGRYLMDKNVTLSDILKSSPFIILFADYLALILWVMR